MRYKQWVKNLAIFLPLYFGHKATEISIYTPLVLLFFAFCFASSAVYLFNDICDRRVDRLHPTKRNRAIASGRLSVPRAYLLIGLLTTAAAGLALYSPNPLPTILLIATYLLLNLLYSLRGKHWPVFDAFFVAAGFILRIEAGGVAAGIPVSRWLFLMMLFLSLLLAFGKRREDLLRLETGEGNTRRVVASYSKPFLDAVLAILSAVLIVLYTLYTVDPDTQALHNRYVVYTVPLVVLGLVYYLRSVIVDGRNCNPTDMLFNDRGLQGIFLVWILAFSCIIYLI